MKFLPSLLLVAASGAVADYMCPAMPSDGDQTSLHYAYTIQNLLNIYYSSIPVNASFFSGLPNADMMASNGMTLAENTVTNVMGLAKQAELGAEAIKEEMMGSMSTSMPMECQYVLSPAPNASAHLMNAFYIEATLCGAFIGLADYLQSPTLNFLSARLAAEHGIHASAIRGMMQPVGFMPDSTMLTPAFTPETVMSSGMEVGMLGDWMGGCPVTPPMAPCGGSVSIGELLATLDGQTADSGMACPSSMMPTATYAPAESASMSTAPVATFTGGGHKLKTTGMGVGLVAVAMGWILS